AGMVHDTRQARRLFPLYGGAVILGGAVGGLLTRPLAATLHAENLLLIWSGTLLATSAVARSLPGGIRRRRRPAGSRVARPSLLAGARDGASYVRGTSLLRWMAGSILLLNVLYFSLSLPFARAVTLRF